MTHLWISYVHFHLCKHILYCLMIRYIWCVCVSLYQFISSQFYHVQMPAAKVCLPEIFWLHICCRPSIWELAWWKCPWPKNAPRSPEVPKSMCWKNVPNVQNVRNVRNVHNVHRIVSQRLNGTPIDYLTWGNHEAWTAQCVHSLKFFQVFESIGFWVCQCKTGRKLQPASSNSLLQEQNAGHGRTSSPQRYL